MFSILSLSISRNKCKLCQKLCHGLNWSPWNSSFFYNFFYVILQKKLGHFSINQKPRYQNSFLSSFYLFSIHSSKISKNMCKICQKLKKYQKLPLTHFIMIFQKFKWPNSQIHMYHIPIFCIHTMNNVYRKVKQFLKLYLSVYK